MQFKTFYDYFRRTSIPLAQFSDKAICIQITDKIGCCTDYDGSKPFLTCMRTSLFFAYD